MNVNFHTGGDVQTVGRWRRSSEHIAEVLILAAKLPLAFALQPNWEMGTCFLVLLPLNYSSLLLGFVQLAKKIREKFNRYLDVVNRNKQVVEASYTAHLTSPLTAIQDCCFIPASMME